MNMPSEDIHVMERSSKFKKHHWKHEENSSYTVPIKSYRNFQIRRKKGRPENIQHSLKHFANKSSRCFAPGRDRTHYFRASSSIPMNN
jgi:hypothetical protein